MGTKAVTDWLLEKDNPAVAYRARTELLGERGDKEPVVLWLTKVLPADWQDVKGLWGMYWLTAIAESGLSCRDVLGGMSKAQAYYNNHPFQWGCSDFMRLRAMARLGMEIPHGLVEGIEGGQLPDGGFLCQGRLQKLAYTPKSCVKANVHALMFCAEMQKKGISLRLTESLVQYFWNHKLFYRTDDLETLMLNAREGWRSIDTFHPFETMRVGIHNIVESLCALGHGLDPRMEEAWGFLDSHRGVDGRYILKATLSKSYLPKERPGKPSKWVTFYALLARKEALLP